MNKTVKLVILALLIATAAVSYHVSLCKRIVRKGVLDYGGKRYILVADNGTITMNGCQFVMIRAEAMQIVATFLQQQQKATNATPPAPEPSPAPAAKPKPVKAKRK